MLNPPKLKYIFPHQRYSHEKRQSLTINNNKWKLMKFSEVYLAFLHKMDLIEHNIDQLIVITKESF